MSKKVHESGKIQGVSPDDITLKQVKEWTKNDLGRAVSFLQAIYSDPDLCDSIAVFMYGRLQNDIQRKRAENGDLPGQGKIFESETEVA